MNGVNLSQCIDEFLAFQHISSDIEWDFGCHNRTYNEYTECNRIYKADTGLDAVNHLKNISKKITGKYNNNEIGILISSGIDSATVAKNIPKGSTAIYATYKEREKDPEIEMVKKYCKINDLNLVIVEVSWRDYEKNIDYLMNLKKNPIHPCEIPVYMCCLKAKEMGIKILFSGWGADTHFGGMDKLLSKNWTLEEFKNRYEYCPRINEKNEKLDKLYEKFMDSKYIRTNEFLTYNYHIMTIKSFFYLPEICGLIHVPLWGYIGLNHKLDLERVRKGESKYIIREAFEILYKTDDLGITEKIPFTRPTDIYMKEHFNEIKYIKILNEYIKKNTDLKSQQKWMVYILNRFLNNVIKTK